MKTALTALGATTIWLAGATNPVLATQTAQQGTPDEVVISAEADFQTYCAVCHGKTGVGNGPVASELVSPPADLTVLSRNNAGTFPEDRVQRVIDGRNEVGGHGTRDMPIWGSWFKFVARSGGLDDVDEETAEVIVSLRIQGMIEYLKTIQKP